MILVSLLPHEFFQVCGKQGSGRSELSAELALRAHPEVLNVLSVDLRVVRVHEVHLMDDDVMEEHPSIELRDGLVRCPTVRDDHVSVPNAVVVYRSMHTTRIMQVREI